MNLIVKMLIVIIRKEERRRKVKRKRKIFWLLKNLLGYLYSKENYIGIELVSV